MADFQVRVAGVGRLDRNLNSYRLNLPREMQKGLFEIGKELEKNIKRRAPKTTGYLQEQINVKSDLKKKQVIISIGKAFYGVYQELGYAPHWIPIEYVDQHFETPYRRGRRVRRPSSYSLVKKSTPFMGPAVKAMTPAKIKRIFNKYLKRARDKAKVGCYEI